MQKIKVNLKERSYPIVIGEKSSLKIGSICQSLKIGADAIIITNHLIKRRFLNKIKYSLEQNNITTKTLLVPDSEKAKSSRFCFELIEKISLYDKKRRIFIVALGGGVIGDLAGFTASIYKRGVPYIQVPTTFLSQIDSSVGGKTAVDLPLAKNLAGTFYQPKAVIVDLDFLRTLPIKQLRTGLAEAIKYAIIKDKVLFYFLRDNHKKILRLNTQAIKFVVMRCVKIKARIVEKDEHEKLQIRTILNFGHTIGHALENAYGYEELTHGEAIGIGMLCASEISVRLNLLSAKQQEQISEIIKLYKLPLSIKNLSINKIMSPLLRDKKFIKAEARFVLPVGIGKVVVRDKIPEKLIREVIKNYISS